MHVVYHSFYKLLSEEQIEWFQSIKLLQGDRNTLQLVVNGKRWKIRIFQLEQEEGII
jgi:hypothetical protein